MLASKEATIPNFLIFSFFSLIELTIVILFLYIFNIIIILIFLDLFFYRFSYIKLVSTEFNKKFVPLNKNKKK